MRVGLGTLFCWVALGCARPAPGPGAAAASAGEPLALQRGPLEGAAPEGLSDLALDSRGRLWAVSERDRSLVILAPRAGGGVVESTVALVGVSKDVDTESLAWLPDGRLALGTELHEVRDSDVVLLAQVTQRSAEIVGELRLPYGPWGVSADKNHGIEGLCVAGGSLVAVTELVFEAAGQRLAPVARYDLARSEWTHHALALTSATGRLSGAACRIDPAGALEVVAIERHYGVARLIRFVMPLEEQRAPISPTVVFDLAAHVDPLPNFEGIVFLDGGFELLTDNSSGVRTGPSELASLRPPKAASDSARGRGHEAGR